MTFGKVLELLKADQLVQRRDWVEKGMWLILIHGQIRKLAPGAPYTENLLRLGYAEGYSEICSHIDLHTGVRHNAAGLDSITGRHAGWRLGYCRSPYPVNPTTGTHHEAVYLE